jgi:tetratricopeptide (TPR) repeat protein
VDWLESFSRVCEGDCTTEPERRTMQESLSLGQRLTRKRPQHQRAASAVICWVFVTAALLPHWNEDARADETGKASLAEADHLLNEGKPQEAISLLLPLLEKQPVTPGVEARLGKAYYEARDLASATLHLGEAVKQNPEDWEATQLLAITCFGTGDLQQASALLLKVIPHLTEGQADAEHLLGLCYLRLQDFDHARRAFAKMFAAAPDNAMAYFILAKMMVGQHMEDAAVPQLAKALEMEPRLAMAHFLLGEIDLTRGDNREALSELQKELEVNPSVWLVYWRMGDAYMRLQRYGEAEQALKQALWLNDSFTGGYLMLGEIELEKNEPDVARGFLERAVKLDPQNPYGHYFLGRAYQKLGKLDEANREFELQKVMRNSKYEDGLLPSRSTKQ